MEYNRNMSDIINIYSNNSRNFHNDFYSQRETPPPLNSRTNRRSQSRRETIQNDYYTNTNNTRYYPLFFRNQVFNGTNLSDLLDVDVFPTQEQLTNATEIIRYNSETIGMTYTSCPISLEPFEEGECICRIRHCSHVFKVNQLYRWFETHVRCPVCRYDIRDTEQPISQEQSTNTSESTLPPPPPIIPHDDTVTNEYNSPSPISPSNTIPNPTISNNTRNSTTPNILNTLGNLLQDAILDELENIITPSRYNTNNTLYSRTFEIPIYTIDISGIAHR
jgi:hypothetical protein